MRIRSMAGLLLVSGFATGALGDTVTINPSKDNTMYNSNGTLASNALGDSMFVGNTAGGTNFNRRALLAFDIASALPAGSTVTSVQLQLQMTKTISGATNVSLYSLDADWGEGTSNAGNSGGGAQPTTGDVTWLHREFDTVLWTNAGGDYGSSASATTSVGGNGSYTWSDAQMVADVQSWLDTPASSYGWIVIGNEASTGTAKRFATREHATAAFRPTLVINYDAPGCYADCDGSGTLNILDYICFGDDFAAGGTYADCDGSSSLNILDYICFGDAFAAGCP